MENNQPKRNHGQTVLLMVCMLCYMAGMVLMLLGRLHFIQISATVWLIPVFIANILLGILLRQNKSKLAIPVLVFAALFFLTFIIRLFV